MGNYFRLLETFQWALKLHDLRIDLYARKEKIHEVPCFTLLLDLQQMDAAHEQHFSTPVFRAHVGKARTLHAPEPARNGEQRRRDDTERTNFS